MNLLMLSGDRTIVAGNQGPFYMMLAEFRHHWERIDVVCPRSETKKELRPFDNVYIHSSPFGRVRMPAFIVSTARTLSRRHEIALVVSHDYGLFRNGVGARAIQRELGVPFVSEIHHVDGFPFPAGLRSRLKRSLAQRHVRRTMDKASAFRTVSRQIAELLARWGVPRTKIRVLNSLYLDLSKLHPPTEGAVRDDDVLFCGRLEPEKGIGLLVDCLEHLVQKRPDLRAVVVGRGSGSEWLERQLTKRNLRHHVRIMPWIDDYAGLCDQYRRSRVLLCTSHSEGNPRVVAEAMACGVPVVSTPVGLVPELVEDKRNGRIVDWNAGRMAAAVEELLGDAVQWSAMSRRAPSSTEAFEKSKVIAELADSYRLIAEETTQ